MSYLELQALRAEALRRLLTGRYPFRYNPQESKVQGDYFNIIGTTTDLPNRIKTREDLDTYLPPRRARAR